MKVTALLNKILNLFEKTEFTKKLFIKARTSRAIGSSRTVEYSWILAHLGDSHKKILDVGSTGSIFPIELASIGYDVYSIDPRSYFEWNGVAHPDMKFIKGDITQAPFTPEFFDVVIAISTIEHIGTEDFFKASVDEAKDLKAIQEIARILKPDGKFIFTVPYRKGAPNSAKRKVSFIRLYNEETIRKRLLNGIFIIELEEYFRKKNGFWRYALPKEMLNLGGKGGLACITARKV